MKDEKQIELSFIKKLEELKYVYREDIKDKAALEENFRKHFQELNRVRLSDSEFARLKENIITPDVFSAAKILRETNTFKRDDDTPLQYTLVNTNDWCKNEYEVINQLRINTENMVFDGENLSDLLAPLDLSWRERTQKELDLMDDLIPLLKKLADGREIVGLNAYE